MHVHAGFEANLLALASVTSDVQAGTIEIVWRAHKTTSDNGGR